MFFYYLQLAINSFKRDLTFCLLIVVSTGLGIGATMTTLTVIHVMSGDPIPDRSAMLFVPHLDPLPLHYRPVAGAPDPSDYLTWPDAMAIVRARIGEHQAAMAGGTMIVSSNNEDKGLSVVNGRFTTADFFSMFGLAFDYGSGWSEIDDENRNRVVVLSESLARRLMGTTDCVGMTIRLSHSEFRIVGVTKNWRPSPMFYADPSAKSFGGEDQFFIPLSTAIDSGMSISGSNTAWGDTSNLKSMLTGPTTAWLQVWVQLANDQQRSNFQNFLSGYVSQQHALGRFERSASEVRVFGLMEYLRHLKLVPPDLFLQLWICIGLWFICIVNVIGLLLSKFMRKIGEISVRRAMGASRMDIFLQFGFESAVIGLFGSACGLLLAELGLCAVRSRPDDYAHLAHMDASMLVLTIVLAMSSTVVAGLLPAWRACRVQPSLQMKSL